MLLRTLLVLRSRRRSPLGIHDVARMRMRVRLIDTDVLRHVNNGVYLSLMDLGRLDLLIRAGAWRRMEAAGVYPVVSSSTMSHRRSLRLFQRYELETRVVGYEDRSVFVEQRFTVRGEVYARGIVRGRFLRRTGGTVSIAELRAIIDPSIEPFAPPEWVARWAADAALPSTRSDAPSVW